jgi:uncharacterized repeat protein (TIGR01451 family)
VNLSEPGQSASGVAITINSSGDAVAAWSRSNGTNTIVQAARRPAGGSWSTPLDLSEPGQEALSAQVAIDPSGEVVAVWVRGSGAAIVVQASAAPAGGSWSTPTDLSVAALSTGVFRVVLDAEGEAIAVWRHSIGGFTIVQAATRPAGGSWSTPVDLSSVSQNSNLPQVAVDPEGNAFAVWSRSAGLGIQGARRPAGGSWSSAEDLSVAGGAATSPQISVDSAGDAVAVWTRNNGANTIAQAIGFATGPHLLSSSIPSAGTVGDPLPFSAGWWDAWSPLGSIAWDFDDGATAEGEAVNHAYASPGTYQVGATATDLRGESSSVGGGLTIDAAPVSPPPVSPASEPAGSGNTGTSSPAGNAGGEKAGAEHHLKPHPKAPGKPTKKGKAALSVALSASASFARPTSVLTYTITVANPGGSAARAVKVCDRLPSGQSALHTQPRATAGDSPCWSLGTLEAGARRTLRLSAQVDAFATAGSQVDRAIAGAGNVAGTHVDTAILRVRPLPATACGSSLSGTPGGKIALRC